MDNKQKSENRIELEFTISKGPIIGKDIEGRNIRLPAFWIEAKYKDFEDFSSIEINLPEEL